MNDCMIICLLSFPLFVIYFGRCILPVKSKQETAFPFLPSEDAREAFFLATIVLLLIHLPIVGLWHIAAKPYNEVVAKAAEDAQKNEQLSQRMWDGSNLISFFVAIPVSIGSFADSCGPFFWYFSKGACWLYISYSFLILSSMFLFFLFALKDIFSLKKFKLYEIDEYKPIPINRNFDLLFAKTNREKK